MLANLSAKDCQIEVFGTMPKSMFGIVKVISAIVKGLEVNLIPFRESYRIKPIKNSTTTNELIIIAGKKLISSDNWNNILTKLAPTILKAMEIMYLRCFPKLFL